jgi:hypothetical protein
MRPYIPSSVQSGLFADKMLVLLLVVGLGLDLIHGTSPLQLQLLLPVRLIPQLDKNSD